MDPRGERLDGAVLFIDIDGFTSLTDLLNRSGAEGVELLHGSLGRVLEPVIGCIERHDGVVVHVVGDALLAVFGGASAVQRAARVAWWARSHVERVSIANRWFSMSAGIDVGRIDALTFDSQAVRGQQGGPLRVIGGDAVRVAQRLEHGAESGDIVMSDRAAEMLPASWRECLAPGVDTGTRTVRFIGKPPGRYRSATDDVGSLLRLELERHDVVVPEQHKYSETSFVTIRSARKRRHRLGELVDAIHAGCAESGVVVFEADPVAGGIRLRLLMGAPVAGGRTRTSLMRETCRAVELATRLGVDARAGVAGGRTFVGTLCGGSVQRTLVIGDSVNTAARLGARARSGEVLTEWGSALRAGIHPTSRPTTRRLRGKSQPVSVGRIELADVPVEASNTPPFVGRRRELDALNRLLDDAHSAGAIALVGEAGVGKSRLLEEVLEQRRRSGDRVLRVDAYSDDIRRPFGFAARLVRGCAATSGSPLGDGADLRSWLDGIDADVPEYMIPTLNAVLGVARISPSESNEEPLADRLASVRRELRRILEALRADAVDVIVANDLYLMDASSSKLLEELASAGPTRFGPRLLVTCRPGYEDIHAILSTNRRIELNPLPATDTRALLVSAGVPDNRLELIVNESHGNPLHALELAALAMDSDDSELRLGLAATIERRIDGLGTYSPIALDALRIAAVIGDRAPRQWVSEALGADLEGADRAAVGGFVTLTTDSIGFRHHRIRDVVLTHMEAHRRDLHRRMVDIVAADAELDPDDRLLLLGDHATGTEDASLIWRHEVRAATVAHQRLATPDAFGRVQRAVEAGRSLPDVNRAALCDAAVLATTLAEQVGRYETAEQLSNLAMTLASTSRQQVRTMAARATVLRVLGRSEEAIEVCSAVRRLGHRPRGAARGELLLVEAAARHRIGDFAGCMAVARTVTDIGGIEPRQLAKAMMLHDIASFDLDRTTTFGRRWIELFRESGDLRLLADGLTNLAVNAYHVGDYSNSLSLSDDAIARYRHIDDPAGEATAVCNKGEVLSDQGHLDAAEACFEDGGRLWEQSAEIFGVAYQLRNLARLADRRGKPDRALELLRRGQSLFDDLDNPDEMTEFLAVRLDVEVGAGLRPRTWRRSLAQLESIGAAIDHHMVLRITAMIEERSGRGRNPFALYANAASLARGSAAFEELLSCLGAVRTGGDHEVREFAERADELMEQMGIQPNGWISRLYVA